MTPREESEADIARQREALKTAVRSCNKDVVVQISRRIADLEKRLKKLRR
jgi:hypothetical protein